MICPSYHSDPEKEKWADLGINCNLTGYGHIFESELGKALLNRTGNSYCLSIRHRTGFHKYGREEIKFFGTKEKAEDFVEKELSCERVGSRLKNALRSILQFLDYSGAEGRHVYYDASDMHNAVTRASFLESFLYSVPSALLTGGNPYVLLIWPAIIGARNLHARYEFEKTKMVGK
jgi:hypothetical protein